MKKLVISVNKDQYQRLLKLLTEMPPRDLTVAYGSTELFAFEVNAVGEMKEV